MMREYAPGRRLAWTNLQTTRPTQPNLEGKRINAADEEVQELSETVSVYNLGSEEFGWVNTAQLDNESF